MQNCLRKCFSKVAENKGLARASLPSLERASKIKGFARASLPSLERSDETVKVLVAGNLRAMVARFFVRARLQNKGARSSEESFARARKQNLEFPDLSSKFEPSIQSSKTQPLGPKFWKIHPNTIYNKFQKPFYTCKGQELVN